MKSKSLSNSKVRFIVSVLLTLMIFGLGFIAGNMALTHQSSAQGRMERRESDQSIQAFWDALAIIEEQYVDAVDVEVLIEGAIEGMVDALEDEHSGYLHPELCERASNFSGEFSGIGVTARTSEDSGEIVVVSVIPNSPAERVGLLPGDIFHEVDGYLVAGMTQAQLSTLVPGPRGTSVTITVKRGDAFLTFDITRDVFTLPNVTYEIVSDSIAHITMLDFNDVSREQLDDALAAVNFENAAGLIFDIRNNHGGTLSSAVEVGGAFIKDGVLLRQVARNQSEEITRTRGPYADIHAPIVVLVDETSASASEALAGAMQDYGVATIIGETTFGKGTVQNIVPDLSNDGCLRITVKRWLRSNGSSIHKQGIRPDIIVEWDPVTDEEREDDLQLAAAIHYLETLRD